MASAHRVGDTFAVPGILCTNHHLTVPLNHFGSQAEGELIDVFARELVTPENASKASLPYLLFLQGGPGFECARPATSSGWVRAALAQHRVVLMDQRGTGRSTAINAETMAAAGRSDPPAQAAYLKHFRGDAIVEDAEALRRSLLPDTGRWTLLGQSYGGFCNAIYMSRHPEALETVLFTGGIPPGIDLPCAAETVYRRTYESLLVQNRKFYERYPGDVEAAQAVVAALTEGGAPGVTLPCGSLLTPRLFQSLGMSCLGSGGGFERLHYLLEDALDGPALSVRFKKAAAGVMPWDTNPLYALLHEPVYSQGEAPQWAAHRVREEPQYKDLFDASLAVEEGRPVFFTGEHVFPWMFEDVASLRPFKEAAHLLAEDADWGRLYDSSVLRENEVPCAAASYTEDLYVDYQLVKETAAKIKGLRQWDTNEFAHSGIRDAGGRIFDKLLSMARNHSLLF